MKPHITAAAMLALIASASIAIAGNCYTGACDSTFGARHVKNFSHGHVSNFGHSYSHGFSYYPSGDYGAAGNTYKSLAQQIAEANRKELENLLGELGIIDALKAQQTAQAGGGVLKHCGSCHGNGGANQDSFDVTGEWSYEKANRAQQAFMGILDGVPNMAKKAGIQGDGEAIQEVLTDLAKLPTAGTVKPAVEPSGQKDWQKLFGTN